MKSVRHNKRGNGIGSRLWRVRAGAAGYRSRWLVALGSVAVGTSVASGQEVFAPLGKPYDEKAQENFFTTNGLPAAAAERVVDADKEAGNPLRVGVFSFHPRIDYQFINGSGLLVGTTNYLVVRQVVNGGVTNFTITRVTKARVASSIQHTVSPGMQVAIGRYWTADASANINNYSDHQFNDYVGYNFSIAGSIPQENWIFGASAGFNSSESSQIELGGQARQESIDTGLSAIYGADKRVRYEFGLSQDIQLNEEFNNTFTWSTMNWVNYTATTRSQFALGAGGGYNKVETGSESSATSGDGAGTGSGNDSIFEQLQGRVIWNPLSKLAFNISGGAQFQQIQGEDSSSIINPIYSLSAGYSPFESTRISLAASRETSSSLTTDEITDTTSFSLGFSQRLFGRVRLGIVPSFNLREYEVTPGDAAPEGGERKDEYWSIQVRLSTVVFKKMTLSAFVQYSENSFTPEGYDYDTRQFGFQVGYRF